MASALSKMSDKERKELIKMNESTAFIKSYINKISEINCDEDDTRFDREVLDENNNIIPIYKSLVGVLEHLEVLRKIRKTREKLREEIKEKEEKNMKDLEKFNGQSKKAIRQFYNEVAKTTSETVKKLKENLATLKEIDDFMKDKEVFHDNEFKAHMIAKEFNIDSKKVSKVLKYFN